MVEQRELNILKKSILVLNKFTENVDSVNSGNEFLTIYNRNLETIRKIAEERNSGFLKNRLNQYPKITFEEVDDYIKKKEVSFIYMVFGSLVDSIIRTIKTKGNSPNVIKTKIYKIQELNNDIFKVIENPYLEEIYKLQQQK